MPKPTCQSFFDAGINLSSATCRNDASASSLDGESFADRVFTALTRKSHTRMHPPYFTLVSTPVERCYVDSVDQLYDEDRIAASKCFDAIALWVSVDNKTLRDEIELCEMDQRGDIWVCEY